MTQSDKPLMTPAEYLAFEETTEDRHEYLDGVLREREGATGNHNMINMNVTLLLREKLRPLGCGVYAITVKVASLDKRYFFYPDVVVTCDERDQKTNEDYISYPKVIVEILSPGTEAFDRGQKFHYYQRIPSLQEYILVDSTQYLVESYQRQTENTWAINFYENIEAIAHIESLELDLSLSEIYEGIEFSVDLEKEGI